MDLKYIKELMGAMRKTGIKRLRLKNEGYELELEGESFDTATAKEAAGKTPTAYETRPVHVKAPDIPTSLHPPLETAEPAGAIEEGQLITSPMVGTFYASSGPDESSLVKVGDTVTKETVVCIIEAMKVMNEVKAGLDGIVKETLVENGHPVEFGTKLFRIT